MKNKAWIHYHIVTATPKDINGKQKCCSVNVPEDAPFLYYLLLQLNKLLCKSFPSSSSLLPSSAQRIFSSFPFSLWFSLKLNSHQKSSINLSVKTPPVQPPKSKPPLPESPPPSFGFPLQLSNALKNISLPL